MVKITRTFGPIHFEDLDPHRFEDLIRELAYDYKDWQTIEATGRGGSDEGFDIRAYERVVQGQPVELEAEDAEEPHPMAGNRWMAEAYRTRTFSRYLNSNTRTTGRLGATRRANTPRSSGPAARRGRRGGSARQPILCEPQAPGFRHAQF